MKTNYYLLLIVFSLLITVSCKKETLEPFTPKNYFKEFQTEKSQTFDLDTIWEKEIIGKHGTKINFYRELFDVKDGEKIQLELIELYDYKEVFNRGIQTLTTDGKLLETSGVLKVTFTSHGKELKLSEGEFLKVYPPNGKLKNNDIFLSQKDSLGNITWDIIDQNYCDFSINVGGGIWSRNTVHKDSIPKLKKRNLLSSGFETWEDLVERSDELFKKDLVAKEFFVLKNNTSQWINIDRFVDVTSRLNFKLESKEESFSGFDAYINYKDLKSFVCEPRNSDNLNFYNIPLNGEVFMTIIGENKEGLFYDRIELKQNLNNSKIELNMKKTNKEELKKLFD